MNSDQLLTAQLEARGVMKRGTAYRMAEAGKLRTMLLEIRDGGFVFGWMKSWPRCGGPFEPVHNEPKPPSRSSCVA